MAPGKSLTTPTITKAAIKPVPKNTKKVELITFLNRPALSILAIADVTEKKTKGITKVNIKFKKISPNGFKTSAFSLIKIPIKLPMITEESKMIGNR